jgi:hypothetical protein
VPWNHDKSLKRVQKKLDEVQDVEVSKLSREMDFQNISLKHAKKVYGAHLYVDIPNFGDVLSKAAENDDEADVIRVLHIHARELTRIVEKDFGAAKVHFQGPKLHAVVYRPIDDDEEIAKTALLLVACIDRTVQALNELSEIGDFEVAAGIDLGDAVATMNNVAGDRELLFLGSPANVAAKIIRSGIRVTSRVVEALPDDYDSYLNDLGNGLSYVELSSDEVDALLEDEDFAWSLAQSKDRLKDDFDRYSADDVKISGTQGQIDKSKLGLVNTKRVTGVSVFVDVDGFTKYVEEAYAEDDDLVEAVRSYHVFRSEMRFAAVDDYGALRVQYQGDRMQAVVFLPVDDEAEIALRAVQLAAGINSSVAETLAEVIPDAVRPVAIGADLGEALLFRLGEHGQPDVMCIGEATENAASSQLKLDGKEIGISKKVRDLLPDELAAEFRWVSEKGCYVARDLTADRVERLLEGARLDARVASPVTTRKRGVTSGRPWQAERA